MTTYTNGPIRPMPTDTGMMHGPITNQQARVVRVATIRAIGVAVDLLFKNSQNNPHPALVHFVNGTISEKEFRAQFRYRVSEAYRRWKWTDAGWRALATTEVGPLLNHYAHSYGPPLVDQVLDQKLDWYRRLRDGDIN